LLRRELQAVARTRASVKDRSVARRYRPKDGFSDQSHFANRFRELMGLPPRAFRVKQRAMDLSINEARTERRQIRRFPCKSIHAIVHGDEDFCGGVGDIADSSDTKSDLLERRSSSGA